MGNVNSIIAQLNHIVSATYEAPPNSPPAPSRKTLHRINFDNLQGAAADLARSLTNKPNPDDDAQENNGNQYALIEGAVTSYCKNTQGQTDDVWNAFVAIQLQWEAFGWPKTKTQTI
jgi:hypothetical protein